ncbi:MAG: hypothetical protein HKN89_08455 [Eudoraea sp.]|nr:hypothetical protein [Eudoraea sp.]
MKKAIYIFGLMALLACQDDEIYNINGEIDDTFFVGEYEWVKSYGGSGEDTPRSIIRTRDGGYAVFGFSNSTDGDLSGKTTPVNDYWLLRLDSEGELLWSKTYGGSRDDRGQAIIQTADGGYAITGYAMSGDGDSSNNEGFHDNWILRLDSKGNILWERSFGFSGHDHSYDIVQTADGGFFFVGFLDISSARSDGFEEKATPSTRHGVGEFWGTKIDANGNLQWRRYFGGTNNDRAYSVVPAWDGGFVMAGASESNDFDITNSRGSYDFWIIKISDEGDMIWQKSYGGSGVDIAYDISLTNDGAYVVTGQSISSDSDIASPKGDSDIWMIKIDKQGEMLWERSIGGSASELAQSIESARRGGFIISGHSRSSDGDSSENFGENDMWVVRTDDSGQVLWQQAFGGQGLDFAFDTVENPDKSVLLVGESASPQVLGLTNKGQTDLVVIKIR